MYIIHVLCLLIMLSPCFIDETKQAVQNIEQASVTPLFGSKKQNHQQLQVLTKGRGNNRHELVVSFETEEDIWKAAGKMVGNKYDKGT